MNSLTNPDSVTSSAKRRDAISPTPWRIDGQTIRDADGVVVMSALNPASMATRRLIVEAVNHYHGAVLNLAKQISLREKLYAELGDMNDVAVNLTRSRDAVLAEAERLRDLVRRLADTLQSIIDAAEGRGVGRLDEGLVREAREALVEDKP